MIKSIVHRIAFIRKEYDVNLLLTATKLILDYQPKFIEVTSADESIKFNFSNSKLEQLLSSFSNNSTLEIYNDETRISISYPAGRESPLTFYYKDYSCSNNLKENLISLNKISGLDSFLCYHIYDGEFVYWQSQESISVYELYNKPHRKLNKKIDESFGNRIIDIEQNCGRDELVGNLWFQSSYIMIYGKEYLKHLPKDVLYSFTKCESNFELDSGAVYVKLYNDIFKSNNKKNLNRMCLFRQRARPAISFGIPPTNTLI